MKSKEETDISKQVFCPSLHQIKKKKMEQVEEKSTKAAWYTLMKAY